MISNVVIDEQEPPRRVDDDARILERHHLNDPVPELQLVRHLRLLRPVKTVCRGPRLILDLFLGFCLTLLVALDLGFRDRVFAQVDNPELGVLRSLLPLLAGGPLTLEAWRPIKPLAILQVFGPDRLGTEAIDELPGPSHGCLVVGEDRSLVEHLQGMPGDIR
jgi:hypothetical protein